VCSFTQTRGDLEEENLQLTRTIGVFTKQATKLRAELEQANYTNDLCEQQFRTINEEVSMLRSDKVLCQEAVDKQVHLIDSFGSQLQCARQEVEVITAQKLESDKSCANLKEENDKLQAALHSKMQENEDLISQLATEKSQHKEIQEKGAQDRKACAVASILLTSTKKEVERAQGKSKKLELELHGQKTQTEALSSKIAVKETDIANLRRENSSLCAKLSEMIEVKEHLESELATTRFQLVGMSVAKKKADQDLAMGPEKGESAILRADAVNEDTKKIPDRPVEDCDDKENIKPKAAK